MADAVLQEVESQGFDIEVAMIQGLIPLGLKAVEDRLQREVELLAGKKQAHGKDNVRWGKQAGSVYLRDQKVPVMHPRVRNKITDSEVPLVAYGQMQEPYRGDRQTMLRLLQGISTHKYSQSMELVPEVFGISPSNVSRRFKKSTLVQLRALKNRSLPDSRNSAGSCRALISRRQAA
jgi:AraC-like DNA-binding protein